MLNGVKYLISNAGIATTVIAFACPKGGGRVSAFIVDLDPALSPDAARVPCAENTLILRGFSSSI